MPNVDSDKGNSSGPGKFEQKNKSRKNSSEWSFNEVDEIYEEMRKG